MPVFEYPLPPQQIEGYKPSLSGLQQKMRMQVFLYSHVKKTAFAAIGETLLPNKPSS